MTTTTSPAHSAARTREEWLQRAVPVLIDLLRGVGAPAFAVPQVSVGFPSRRALSAKNRAIGQCWTIPGDRASHIFVSPVLAEPLDVLAVLLHELIHAAVPKAGHKGEFRTLAKATGLIGKMTSTEAGPELLKRLNVLLSEIGAYPHHVLTADEAEAAIPKQGARMLKIECPDCGYTCRTSAKWLALGLPTCCCGAKMVAEEAEAA